LASRRVGRKGVNHPGSVSGAFDEPVLSQVSEVLRNLCLRKFKDLLKMADAQRSMGKQVNDSKPSRVTKALVNSDQVHIAPESRPNIFVNNYIV
jgi:hypothetical protein